MLLQLIRITEPCGPHSQLDVAGEGENKTGILEFIAIEETLSNILIGQIKIFLIFNDAMSSDTCPICSIKR